MPGLKLWGEEQLARMKQDMDRLFEALCTDFGLPPASPLDEAGLSLARTASEIVIRLAAPDLSPEDFSVSVNARRLVITGHSARKEPDGTLTTRTLRREIYLPCPVQADQVSASYENGVVEVRLPRCVQNNNSADNSR